MQMPTEITQDSHSLNLYLIILTCINQRRDKPEDLFPALLGHQLFAFILLRYIIEKDIGQARDGV